MSNSAVEGLIHRLAEMEGDCQKRLQDFEEQIEKLSNESDDEHAKLEQIERCRRTLLDLQAEI